MKVEIPFDKRCICGEKIGDYIGNALSEQTHFHYPPKNQLSPQKIVNEESYICKYLCKKHDIKNIKIIYSCKECGQELDYKHRYCGFCGNDRIYRKAKIGEEEFFY